jgi:hypothetical protein
VFVVTAGRHEVPVTIDGVQLTDAQVMTLRVAVSNWRWKLSDSPEEREGLGKIADLYLARLEELEGMLIR